MNLVWHGNIPGHVQQTHRVNCKIAFERCNMLLAYSHVETFVKYFIHGFYLLFCIHVSFNKSVDLYERQDFYPLRGQCQAASLTEAVHLSKGNAGFPKQEQKHLVVQNCRIFLDPGCQCEQTAKAWSINLYDCYQFFARGVNINPIFNLKV